MQPLLAAIPTNVITGFLGAGKTTLIQQLLATKPEHERWAVLVNANLTKLIDQYRPTLIGGLIR